jgi:hypothetical protein
MQVDTGLHPKNQDKDVRFRTTYYFRVFDYCAADSDGGIKTPFAIDSLYRFRMTGKANSLTTRVNFESGTLTAGQIDPFGATVAFDKKNRQFFFKTQDQVQREAARERQFDELDRLLDKYKELKWSLRTNLDTLINKKNKQLIDEMFDVIERQIALLKGAPGDSPSAEDWDQLLLEFKNLKQKLIEEPDARVSFEDQVIIKKFMGLIESQIVLISGVPGGLPPIEALDGLVEKYQTLRKELESKPREELSDEDKKFLNLLQLLVDVVKVQIDRSIQQTTQLPQVPSKQNYCQNLRRGFQILGPEGWRTFNQDERLIMAMNATGEALIATMQELAGRVLDNQPIEAELLLPLIEEDLRITLTERELDYFSPDEPDQIVNILEKAIKAFEEKEVSE